MNKYLSIITIMTEQPFVKYQDAINNKSLRRKKPTQILTSLKHIFPTINVKLLILSSTGIRKLNISLFFRFDIPYLHHNQQTCSFIFQPKFLKKKTTNYENDSSKLVNINKLCIQFKQNPIQRVYYHRKSVKRQVNQPIRRLLSRWLRLTAPFLSILLLFHDGRVARADTVAAALYGYVKDPQSEKYRKEMDQFIKIMKQ